MTAKSIPACAVLLAGGRGTRFWPRSRMRTPKQLLNIVGTKSMLRQTAERVHPIFEARNLWAVTNAAQVGHVRRELPGVPSAQILAEPIGRNTAAAIGLAAIHIARKHGDAVMAVLPADSFIADAPKYRAILRAAVELGRQPGNLVVLGIPPTRPETGYGYIERGATGPRIRGARIFSVQRFTEKPELAVARRYVSSGKYLWNAGIFFWRASTFLENLKRFLPRTHDALPQLGETIGTRRYEVALRRIYPRLENISVDFAVMEPATRVRGSQQVYVIPAEVGWSDIGSWAAVYELLADGRGANVSAGPRFTLDSHGNFFWSPKKFVAAVGIDDLVMVETDDAILLCERDCSQDVGKIVKWLERKNRKDLL
jgi:mannose-1-phosphate guanylyltransferase